ncbi:glycogen synthase GlgA [Roseibium salinum]|uniref:Glycogen synthase n=1 Tax=Roseibium salinum TaxID=1604349 RepID=A0ABT3R8Q0_9HYPH|nr:glycogen synthase GlgA [Roseibium sp. DSM 29163]MCX2725691.1 glycogen synthase GlgA [Roseibium sp. DSM 29163]
MKVLMVASECTPFIKTGGLADVVGALPQALARAGIDCRTVLPAYPSLQPLVAKGKEVAGFSDLPGGAGRLVQVAAAGMTLLLLDAPQQFDRPGQPYTGQDGLDWPDNHLRFAALAQVAARIGLEGIGDWKPDIVHVHDWQAALAPVYLKQAGGAAPRSVLTVHNIAFQGRFGPHVVKELGLRSDWFHPDGFEYYGDVSFLKGGLMFADRITTVSPTYAREILTPEFGMGLDGVLRARADALSGILNGIDTEIWNPAEDKALKSRFDARSLGRKRDNRAQIAVRLGLDPDNTGPLFCVISRLTHQKGLDALAGAVPHIVARGGQLAVLGTGEPGLEKAFLEAADAHPHMVGVHIGFDEGLAHLLQGGSDAILIPSRFEPCGLTQLCALRYGTLPVVARTGGLADTVIDANAAAVAVKCATGFVFDDVSVAGLEAVIDRVCDRYADRPSWQAMQRSALRQPVGWEQSAEAYADLYRELGE